MPDILHFLSSILELAIKSRGNIFQTMLDRKEADFILAQLQGRAAARRQHAQQATILLGETLLRHVQPAGSLVREFSDAVKLLGRDVIRSPVTTLPCTKPIMMMASS